MCRIVDGQMARTIDTNKPAGQALPPIPGGWTTEDVPVSGKTFRLTSPADPDAFLDESEVLAAHKRDGFMPYWPYLWPAAQSLAEAVIRGKWPAGTRALEIGCGIGLVGLAALSRGLCVTLSDYEPLAVELAAYNALQNGFDRFERLILDWRSPLPQRFSLILACDVIYETRNHVPILDLIETMLAVGGSCWIGDPGRSHTDEFIQLAQRGGFVVRLCDSASNRYLSVQIGQYRQIVLTR